MHVNNNINELRVLVVDDSDLMLRHTKFLLQQESINRITLLADGQSALNKIHQKECFDLILLDLNMPIMDGVEVLRNLAACHYSGAVALFSGEDPAILRTAEKLASAHNLNIIGSLIKPVTPDSLRALLANFNPADKVEKRNPIKPVDADELQQAIQNSEIQPYFQPKVKACDKQIASVEVLARWHHSTRSIIPPIAFIPVAEEHGLIDMLTMSILEQAMEQFGQWLQQGFNFTLGVNISAVSLEQVDLPEKLSKLASIHSVPCSQIVLEITESFLLQNLTTSLEVLVRLRLKGFGLSIDDFGTGYSSMSQLNQIPFTELKIDRAFVHGVHKDPTAKAVLESCVILAKKLKMTTVAEGVEDQDDWDSVVIAGCDLVQGYFIAKPMPAEQFEQWLRSNHSPPMSKV